VTAGLEADLRRLLGDSAVATNIEEYTRDSTEMQGLKGRADAVVIPETIEQVQKVVRWCSERKITMVPRGGGTGFAGGAVPDGGVVVSLERLNHIRTFEPEFWRIHVDAGITTGRVQRLARESGLYYPPDPGASEQSQIGGNIACNAGGPHSFKYGVTRDWVTGLEAVVAGGQLVHFGGSVRKDVAAYDLRSLFAGSEGTLGIVTGAWLRLIPAPDAQVPIVAAYPDRASGLAALRQVYGLGLRTAVLEYLDAGTIAAAGPSFPNGLPAGTAFLVIAEADGTSAEAAALASELSEALSADSLEIRVASAPADQRDIWRWRSGVSFAVRAQRGGKMGEDIAVPFDRLEDALELGERAGKAFDLPTCSWGHAGDGNLHATFLIDADSADDIDRATQAAEMLFEGTIALGGTASGEHGLGTVKRDQLLRQLSAVELELQFSIKRAFDPDNLFNPGKKLPMHGGA
jgi:glycolate oxidase subunit GlcD